MNAALPRFLKSAYRREPLPSFLVTIGMVDAVIGGFDYRASLLIFGLGTVGVAIVLRWWSQQRPLDPPQPQPQRYLPSRSSRPELPTIPSVKRRPPQ